LSANKDLLSIPNIVFLVAGVYFALVGAAGEGSIYSIIGAILCFVSAGLAIEKDWVLSAPWRLATAAFSIVVLVVQLAANFSVPNASASVVVSILVNGALFLSMLGVLLLIAKEVTASGKRSDEDEEEEEEPESKKKKLTYEI